MHRYSGAGYGCFRNSIAGTISRAQHRWHNPNSGKQRHYYLDASVIQQAVRRAVLVSGIITPATSHSFRHSIYHPAARMQPLGVRSPADLL